jgi:4a-hydroxytetrahydrobiopterin dehydratase
MVVWHTSRCGSQGRHFRTGSFAASARLVQAISQVPGVEDHKPDGDLRHDGVSVRLITYTDDYYGVSQRDVEMARRISAAARRLGLSRGGRAVSRRLSRAATRSDPT